MKTIDRIIDQYRQADFEERLNLFLECPSLREDFTRIDLAETAVDDMSGAVEKPPNALPNESPSWIRSVSLSMKRCWHHCRVALAR